MPYDEAFYSSEAQSSMHSAAIIVPLLVELVGPRSVLDVGCGVGAFSREFMRQGVGEVRGVDSDWVPADALVIPQERFVTANLADSIPMQGRFDLVICLEVAEHLPESRAAGFVEDLCAHAPVVAFSAAIPQQGGTEHLNERWPSYVNGHLDVLAGGHGWSPLVAIESPRGQVVASPPVVRWVSR